MAVKLRTLSMGEAQTLNPLAYSRQAAHRLVQRVPIIWASAQELSAPAIAQRVWLSALQGHVWIQRLNPRGRAGLADAARPGRPYRHDATACGTVMALARTKPQSLGQPFALWTLARLQQALQERQGVHVTRATIWKWLQAEGLPWKRQQNWFQVTVEAAFAENRGPSSRTIRSRARHGRSSASTHSSP